jgi:hypothetical protein
MNKKEQRRIARELCCTYRVRLLDNIKHFPKQWNGCHVRALLALMVKDDADRLCVKRADRELRADLNRLPC